ncbi:MAG TPA: Imm17 family immunity protein [Chloroflexota bacterium]|nr:Imm17 family immunity protein [Chloroflexota bacterium]
MGFVFLIIGLFVFTGALLDASWFFDLTRSARLGYPLGRKLTRIFYTVIGLGFIIMGLMMLLEPY